MEMWQKMLGSVVAIGSALSLVACDTSSITGGDDEVASDCLRFGVAQEEGKQYRHTIYSCGKAVQVLEQSNGQRFVVPKSGSIEIILDTATPSMAACYDPYRPEVQDDGDFVCKKP